MRKHWSAAISFALAAAMLAGCGASGTADTAADSTGASTGAESAAADTAESAEAAAGDDAGTLHLAWTADIQTLDVQTTSANYMIPMNVFDRLFEIKLNDDGSTELVPSLVKEYTVSDDGLTYHFILRYYVIFSD